MIRYCTRCGHNEDCHGPGCKGRRKNGEVCRCPGFARPLGSTRRRK